MADTLSYLASIAPPVICVNGEQDGVQCKCNKGWSSEEVDLTVYNPYFSAPYSLCNILTKDGLVIEKARKRKESIIALAVIGSLIVIAFLGTILWCFWIGRKKKRSYRKLSESGESNDSPEDVINEVATRREMPVPRQASSDGSISRTNPATENNASRSPSDTTNEQPTLQDPSSAYNLPEPDVEPSPSPAVSTFSSEHRNFNLEEAHGALNMINETGIRPSNPFMQQPEAQVVYSDYEGLRLSVPCQSSSRNVNIDELFSLSAYERLRTQSEPLLYPCKAATIPPRRTSSEKSSLAKETQDRLHSVAAELDSCGNGLQPVQPNVELGSKVKGGTELTRLQKQEEWDKFLQMFTTNKISRRRSLCVDPEQQLELAVIHLKGASKVQSMPSMFVNPFTLDQNANMSQPKSLNDIIDLNVSLERDETGESRIDSDASNTSVWSGIISNGTGVEALSSHSASSSEESMGFSNAFYFAVDRSKWEKKIYDTIPSSSKTDRAVRFNSPGPIICSRVTKEQAVVPKVMIHSSRLAANFGTFNDHNQKHRSSKAGIAKAELENRSLSVNNSGDKELDPYELTATLKAALRASKSRSLDSVVKK